MRLKGWFDSLNIQWVGRRGAACVAEVFVDSKLAAERIEGPLFWRRYCSLERVPISLVVRSVRAFLSKGVYNRASALESAVVTVNTCRS